MTRLKSKGGRSTTTPAAFFFRTIFRCVFFVAVCTVVLGGHQAVATSDEEVGLRSLQLRSEHAELLARLRQATQSTSYIVIDTNDNRLQVRSSDNDILRQVVCSTGAARRFEGPKPSRQRWRFATPQGRFSVIEKVEDPIWVKPVWQFLEAGEDVPVFAEDPRRFQPAVLGEYALYFAEDYMIHGPLYEVNLGRNMTHGCVRVGSEDLRYLYQEAKLGWPIYIY